MSTDANPDRFGVFYTFFTLLYATRLLRVKHFIFMLLTALPLHFFLIHSRMTFSLFIHTKKMISNEVYCCYYYYYFNCLSATAAVVG